MHGRFILKTTNCTHYYYCSHQGNSQRFSANQVRALLFFWHVQFSKRKLIGSFELILNTHSMSASLFELLSNSFFVAMLGILPMLLLNLLTKKTEVSTVSELSPIWNSKKPLILQLNKMFKYSRNLNQRWSSLVYISSEKVFATNRTWYWKFSRPQNWNPQESHFNRDWSKSFKIIHLKWKGKFFVKYWDFFNQLECDTLVPVYHLAKNETSTVTDLLVTKDVFFIVQSKNDITKYFLIRQQYSVIDES